ncbi:histidine phosphatase family protein [uncultured Paraglaciecola sp.]|uniref:histidine phosphatase family protein n=1 Tax=uncultured Paraglaciecola sp. TaxID=1765024 RepID=UPI0030D7EB26
MNNIGEHVNAGTAIGQGGSVRQGEELNLESLLPWLTYQARIQHALQTTVEQAGDAKNIAVFSSGGPIALLCQVLLNVPAKNLMDVNWTLVNCGISKIIISSKGQILSTLNEHTAFEGHHRHLITYK